MSAIRWCVVFVSRPTDQSLTWGVLVACAPEAVAEVLAIFRSEGFDQAAVVGEMVAGAPEVQVA